MANRTVKDAIAVKGTNPQYLIEKIIRTRIYECKYWKEECFALSAELMVDKAMQLKYIGGTFAGNVKPAPFLCLILKMLQIQPDKEIVVEFIRNEDFKYVRLLGAFYLRLTGSSLDCFKYLEPLYNDYRKVRYMNVDGQFELMHVDEFIDQLLREERVCDVQMPRIQKRQVLEETNQLEPRVSALEEDIDAEDDEELMQESRRSPSPIRRRTPSPTRRRSPPPPAPFRRRSRSRERERHRRSRSRERRGGHNRYEEDRDRWRRSDRDKYMYGSRDSRSARDRPRDRDHRDYRR